MFLKRYVNPRMVWCYSGEDYMGKSRPLISSCTKGNSMWGAIDKSMQKYLRALDMLLRDPGVWLKGIAG